MLIAPSAEYKYKMPDTVTLQNHAEVLKFLHKNASQGGDADAAAEVLCRRFPEEFKDAEAARAAFDWLRNRGSVVNDPSSTRCMVSAKALAICDDGRMAGRDDAAHSEDEPNLHTLCHAVRVLETAACAHCFAGRPEANNNAFAVIVDGEALSPGPRAIRAAPNAYETVDAIQGAMEHHSAQSDSENIAWLIFQFAQIKTVVIHSVSGELLPHLASYLNRHNGVAPAEIAKPIRSVKMEKIVEDPWDASFVNGMSKKTIFQIILAANLLKCRPLVHLGCAKIATLIKGKSPEEIRRILGDDE